MSPEEVLATWQFSWRGSKHLIQSMDAPQMVLIHRTDKGHPLTATVFLSDRENIVRLRTTNVRSSMEVDGMFHAEEVRALVKKLMNIDFEVAYKSDLRSR